ncbi:hypothetical protein J8Z82_03380 [Yersinia enterocolitica]|uniref:hypothetical protein n=1 Tax=Yersinia enterocolitica TaxID=630 RepID=UPI001C8D50C5|nr:hypothetical protein [Yersinia enterocolitica]MBX9486904.1 hypothetical protein [Yersinia enterocolitica]MBX9490837.1 hypothetical protein [Yersinia enterocolitica]
MNKKLLFILATIFLSGCASSSKTYGPDGREAHSIDCSGLARTWGACLEKAGDICGSKGYDVFTSTGDGGFVAAANPQMAFAGSTITRNVLISCKN